jgi:hypothetical protein
MLIFTPSCRLFRTMKIEQLLQFSDNSNSVQSTETNNKSIQQTVIHLAPIMHNPRITLFPYSNIQENLTINVYCSNEKNWNSDLYWKVMFKSCNKYGELYFLAFCWHYLFCCYFDKETYILHLFLIYFSNG